MNEWEQGYCESGGVTLRFFRSGGEFPPVVLVHGFTDSAKYFTRLAAALSTEFDVIAYDARGHGASSRFDPQTMVFDDDARVADLNAIIAHCRLDRPVLIGHSMGATTIAAAASQDSDISRGIVLEDPAWWETPPEHLEFARQKRAATVESWRTWVGALQLQTLEEAIALRHVEEPTWNDIDIATSIEARQQFDVGLFDPFLPEWSPWRSVVEKLSCPTLLLIGNDAARGAIITEAIAAEAASLNPLLDWRVIDGAGHHLRFDRFDAYLAAVRAFLGGLPRE